MPAVECDEVKKGKGLNIFIRNKLSSRLQILLAQIKAGNNSNKSKMKSKKYYMFCINIIKSVKKFTTI